MYFFGPLLISCGSKSRVRLLVTVKQRGKTDKMTLLHNRGCRETEGRCSSRTGFLDSPAAFQPSNLDFYLN